MKPKQFDIKFDNPQGVFTAGTNVTGTVMLSIEQPLKVKGIKILFVGQAKAFWTCEHGKNKISYNGNETYFYTFVKLYDPGEESARDNPAGNHAYPFSFQLADTLPSSFEGTRGHVRYICKATIERPWAFDCHVKRAFTVIHNLDIDNFPSASIPVSAQETGEVFGGLCCGSAGFVDIHLDLNKTGYVPGEPIIYTIAVNNRSQKTINQVGLILNQVTTYKGTSNNIWSHGNPKLHPKTRQFFLLYTRDCNFKPDSSKQIQKAIALPSLPPSHLDGCNIIDIKYSIELRVLCGTDISVKKDIIIGTTRSQLQDVRIPSGVQTLPSAPMKTDDLPTYEEALAPPPSYAECVYGRTTIMDNSDDNNTSGDNNWVPSYPYYDFAAFSQQTYGGQPLEVIAAGQSHEINDDDDND